VNKPTLDLKRKFTSETQGPYDDLKLINVVADIEGADFHRDNLIFPDTYSQTAINIIASKYFITPYNGHVGEFDLRQLVDRLVDTLTLWSCAQGYFGKASQDFIKSLAGKGRMEEDMRLRVWKYFQYIPQIKADNENVAIYNDEMKYILSHQYSAFNSPVWMNLGNYTRDTGFQSSACFILSIEDTMESIEENVGIEMEIFRYGSGAGTNLSPLRSSKERLSSGGKSSGPISFMKIYDTAASVTKSGGTTRRAARMNELNDDHGDVLDFITCKSKEEDKAKALIDAGYSSGFNDPDGAYSSVFFQNVNISIHSQDALFKTAIQDKNWALIERHITKDPELEDTQNEEVTPQGVFYHNRLGTEWYLVADEGYYRVIEWTTARTLLNAIAVNTWKSGDPGIQYHDTINRYNTVSNDEDITGSNPCSEFVFLDDTSCNLASLNLMAFYNPVTKKIDIDSYIYVTQLMIISMDTLVEYSKYPTEKIGHVTKQYRPLGLGYSNLGALLLSNGIAYDSDRGRWLARGLTALLNATAYQTSAMLAEVLEPFERWDANHETMEGVINLYKTDIATDMSKSNRTIYKKFNYIYEMAQDVYNTLNKDSRYRNAQATLMAPCGTIGFAMDNSTTGIEPGFSLVSYKNLVGGGVLKLTIREVAYALDTLKYNAEDIVEIIDYIEVNESIKGSKLKEEHYSVFETAVGDNVIAPNGHVDMMGAIQSYLSGAISKTVNVPNEATVEDIYNIYMRAWEKGVKAIAIYRDGSKHFQPVNLSLEGEVEEEIVLGTRRRLPKQCKSDRLNFSIGMHTGYLHTGMYDDGRIGEIWIRMSKQGSTLSGLMDAISTSVSAGLQHGTPLESYIKIFKGLKFEPAGMTDVPGVRFAESIPDFLGKWLENEYINNLEEADIKLENEIVTEVEQKLVVTQLDGPACVYCGGLTFRQGSCYVCNSCGETTGCG